VNISGYDSPTFDKLLTQSDSVYNPAQRLAIYGKIVKILGTDLPMVPLFSADYTAAIGNNVSWPSASGNYVERPWALGVTPRK
jgi:ABC-type transport system substrate-binding protein